MPPVVTVRDTPSGAESLPCLTPWLLCEGDCEGHTTHIFVTAQIKTWVQGYEQIFKCRICRHPRVWGRTITP